MGQYARKMLWLPADDEVLYKYKRKIMAKMQWTVIQEQPYIFTACFGLYRLTRYLKASKPSDTFVYFIIPIVFLNYGVFTSLQRIVFESGYPAHPLIAQERTETINRACFKYPPILKNEIEYLHTKIHPLSEEPTDEDLQRTRYEKTFSIGRTSLDYEKLLSDQLKIKAKEEEVGKRYKVIIEGGQIYLQCIDPFEEVFGISLDSVEGVDLTSILDPFIFDSHRDVTNALFEVYFDLSN